MLKAAFNTLTKIHSRSGQIKRPGSPDIYSPCRLTPSNYFRFLNGPDTTVIRGREFIVTLDSMLGQFAQTILFDEAPVAGTFKLNYNGNSTGDLVFNATASDIQTALRLLAGLSNVLVIGEISSILTIVFPGFSSQPLSITVSDSGTLVDVDAEAVSATIDHTYQTWEQMLKRGDKIIDSVYGLLAIDEIVEMVDLGGAILGFRVRCE